MDRPSAWQDVNAKAFTQCGAPASPAISTPAPTGQKPVTTATQLHNRPGHGFLDAAAAGVLAVQRARYRATANGKNTAVNTTGHAIASSMLC